MTPLFVGGKTEALDGPGNLLKVQLFKKKGKKVQSPNGQDPWNSTHTHVHK